MGGCCVDARGKASIYLRLRRRTHTLSLCSHGAPSSGATSDPDPPAGVRRNRRRNRCRGGEIGAGSHVRRRGGGVRRSVGCGVGPTAGAVGTTAKPVRVTSRTSSGTGTGTGTRARRARCCCCCCPGSDRRVRMPPGNEKKKLGVKDVGVL